jgi:hypothetical protein
MYKNTAPEGHFRGGGNNKDHLKAVAGSADTPSRPATQELFDRRSAKRQRQVKHLHAAGPRPVLEALLAVAAGAPSDAVLADFARVPVRIHQGTCASELPTDRRLR